jgi:hypothetical protein
VTSHKAVILKSQVIESPSPHKISRPTTNNADIQEVDKIMHTLTNLEIEFVLILPVVLYGCETWSLTLREEHRLRVFENRMLRRIFGPKRDEVTGYCRKLHNEELHNLYSSPNIGWAGHVAQMGKRGMHIGYWWGSQKERDH